MPSEKDRPCEQMNAVRIPCRGARLSHPPFLGPFSEGYRSLLGSGPASRSPHVRGPRPCPSVTRKPTSMGESTQQGETAAQIWPQVSVTALSWRALLSPSRQAFYSPGAKAQIAPLVYTPEKPGHRCSGPVGEQGLRCAPWQRETWPGSEDLRGDGKEAGVAKPILGTSHPL